MRICKECLNRTLFLRSFVMKSVVNISSDQIAIWHLGEMRKLERNGVDREIGKVLVELDREWAFDQCLVINGPGGFTNLRVGSLALNLLKTLKGDQISFFLFLSRNCIRWLMISDFFLVGFWSILGKKIMSGFEIWRSRRWKKWWKSLKNLIWSRN